MKAIPHSHILVVWPGSDPFPSDSESLSLLFSLVPPDTNTTSPQVFLSLRQVLLLIKALFATLACLLLCQRNRVVTLCVTRLKRGRSALLLKAEASTKESNRRSRGCPGFNKVAASGRRSSDVPSQAENRRTTLPRGSRRIIWLEGRGAANKPRSVSRSRRQSGHQVEEKTSLVWSRLLIVEEKIGVQGRGTPSNRASELFISSRCSRYVGIIWNSNHALPCASS